MDKGRKVVFVGPPGVGKTSLIAALAGEDIETSPTTSLCVRRLGSSFLWDTPGDDRFSWQCDRLTARADIVVFVEADDPHWKRDYDCKVVKVWNKADLRAKRTKAKDVIETSALTREGLDSLRTIIETPEGAEEPVLKQAHASCC